MTDTISCGNEPRSRRNGGLSDPCRAVWNPQGADSSHMLPIKVDAYTEHEECYAASETTANAFNHSGARDPGMYVLTVGSRTSIG